ncbi:DUF1684 domain-containing protein [Winogradskyella haliclonae]|uniref:DUF1684 domain-containing protein n=1 Tax=Winogradskyella haliclonae TaxID=2048558 RepID=A0ABQ2C275_9FLAO|nr:DUF1684 domain-containing protein [Winogradskyella haliclonae]GGI58153.1 hypothetical protein GCM10011444_24620 [Winogradskyella haliclonae]
MRCLKYIVLLGVLIACSQKKSAVVGDTEYQINQNNIFKDASTSPLKAKDLRVFEGLDFFPFDSTYIISAKIMRTPDAEWFNMKTTTSRLSRERIYGIVTFKLKEKTIQLNIYQGEENMNSEEYKDYLFLPFIDNTNGEDSYAGGRYLDLRIPDDDTIEIDFNKAYNPLCAYNEKYSCPIVPRVNYIDLKVEAGVKAFKK